VFTKDGFKTWLEWKTEGGVGAGNREKGEYTAVFNRGARPVRGVSPNSGRHF